MIRGICYQHSEVVILNSARTESIQVLQQPHSQGLLRVEIFYSRPNHPVNIPSERNPRMLNVKTTQRLYQVVNKWHCYFIKLLQGC